MTACSKRRSAAPVGLWALAIALAPALAVTGCSRSADQSSPAPAKEGAAAEQATPATRPVPESVSGQPLVAREGTEVLAFKVTGMHCSGCATAITGELTKMAGVREARVSFAKGTAWVMLDKGTATDADQIMAAIKKVGYPSEPVPAAQTP